MSSEKKKILVIDDEDGFLEIMQNALNPAGYAVITARDGVEGVKAAKKEKPDLKSDVELIRLVEYYDKQTGTTLFR